jgi:hypothetical protein
LEPTWPAGRRPTWRTGVILAKKTRRSRQRRGTVCCLVYVERVAQLGEGALSCYRAALRFPRHASSGDNGVAHVIAPRGSQKLLPESRSRRGVESGGGERWWRKFRRSTIARLDSCRALRGSSESFGRVRSRPSSTPRAALPMRQRPKRFGLGKAQCIRVNAGRAVYTDPRLLPRVGGAERLAPSIRDEANPWGLPRE